MVVFTFYPTSNQQYTPSVRPENSSSYQVERYKLCSQTVRQRKPKFNRQLIKVYTSKQIKCRRTGYESTTNTPIKKIRTTSTENNTSTMVKQRNLEMRQNKNDTRRARTYLLKRSRRLQNGQGTKKRNMPGQGRRKRREGKEAQRKMQENRTQGVDSNKASRVCHKAEPVTLPPDLPSSSYSRRQRYQVSALPLSRPPSSVNKSTKTKQNY